MTLTLALDTATDLASVAVGREGCLLGQALIAQRRHSAALMPTVEDVLAQVGGSLDQVTRILIADGPGSFTGLRIGVATVQGIVQARDDITVGVAPSLLGAAWVASRWLDGPVAAMYDALRGEVYAAVYQVHHDRVECFLAPTMGTVEMLAERTSVRPLVAVGDGAAACQEAVRRWTGRPAIPPPEGAPRAAALIALERLSGVVRDLADPSVFEPEYGRQAEAQVRWEEKHGRPLPHTEG
jgi:tRNA threonylcarbamoyladenosine biosynthesis protein TsaB